MPKLIDSVVLTTVQSSHLDATIDYANGTLAITGLATKIPLRKVSKTPDVITYAAGTPVAFTLTFTTNPVADTSYVLVFKKVNPRDKLTFPITEENSDGQEVYAAVAASTGETAATLAQKFRTQILAAIANGSSAFASCTGASNVLTLTMGDALSNIATIFKGSTTTVAVAITTPYVKIDGTYAVLKGISADVVSGTTYDQCIVYFRYGTPGIGLTGTEEDTEVYVDIICDHAESSDNTTLFNYIVEVCSTTVY